MWDDKSWKMRKGVSLILVTNSWRLPSWRISPPNTPGPNTPTEMTKKGKEDPNYFNHLTFTNWSRARTDGHPTFVVHLTPFHRVAKIPRCLGGHTGWSTQEPQNSLAVLFSRCTARLGILSTDSEQATLGDVAIFWSKISWLFQVNFIPMRQK